jgi:methylase of polypeptide subunit release factors
VLPLAGFSSDRSIPALNSIDEILGVVAALGAVEFGGGLSAAETALVNRAPARVPHTRAIASAIRQGLDPLGDAISRLRSTLRRRTTGAIYTSAEIVRPMVAWILAKKPERLVDPGCGSGRYAMEAVRHLPGLEILAVDRDPLATLTCRANLATLGAGRVSVRNMDFIRLELEPAPGRTAFIGNPPYVRHHDLSARQKHDAKALARRLGVNLSGLAGLHIHFLLATLAHAKPGDVACFITSAEWLDVAYGRAVRKLLLERTAELDVHLVAPTATTFPDVMTTALFLCFTAGNPERSMGVRYVESAMSLGNLDTVQRYVSRSRLIRKDRWRACFQNPNRPEPAGGRPLGSLCRVSRGEVTGANDFFVMTGTEAHDRGLQDYVVPVISSAREVLTAGGLITKERVQKVLLAPPPDIELGSSEHARLRAYIRAGERSGVHKGYVCRHREPWWRLSIKRPPLVGTYMARQPPAFALNPDKLAIVNVIHGLYPLEPMPPEQLREFVDYLNTQRHRLRGQGRVYHGGLEKFEPRELEAVPIRWVVKPLLSLT